MNRYFNLKLNKDNANKGFTLVELIIGVAILAIVTAAIAGFMVTGTKNYTNQNTEVMIQEEAQLAVNQMADIIIDAARSVSYKEVGEDKIFVVYNGEEDEDGKVTERYPGEKNYYFYYRAEDREIAYTEFAVAYENPSEDGDSIDCLLAEDVSDFKVDLSMLESKRTVGLSVTIERRNKKYTANTNITIRNKILYNIIDPEVVEPEVEFRIQMPKKIYVLEPNDTFEFPTPTIIGKNIKRTTENPSFTFSTDSDAVSLTADGKITIKDLKNGSVPVSVLGVYKENGKTHKSIANFTVEIKRANSINLSCSGSAGSELAPGETITITGSVNGNRMSYTCDKCKASTAHDLEFESTKWVYDSNIFTEVSRSASQLVLKVKEDAPTDADTTIKAYSYHSIHNGSNNSGAGYKGGKTGADGSDYVYGELELKTEEEHSPYTWAGFLTYGYTDSGSGYENPGIDTIIVARVADSATPDHRNDKVFFINSTGANIRLDPDTFGLDWTKNHYVWVQYFNNYNNHVNRDDFRIDYDKAFNDNFNSGRNVSYYTGDKYEVVKSVNGMIDIPSVVINYNGYEYTKTNVELEPVIGGISGERYSFYLSRINQMKRDGSNNYIGLTVYKDGNKLSSNISHNDGGVSLNQGNVIYEPGANYNYYGLRIGEIKGNSPKIWTDTSSEYKKSLGDYTIIPSIVYRSGDLSPDYLKNQIFWIENYEQDFTTVRELECKDSAIHLKVLDRPDSFNLNGLYMYVNKEMRTGSIFFPEPGTDDFKKYFNFNSDGTLTYNNTAGFIYYSNGNYYTVNFTKMECRKSGNDYYLTMYYTALNPTWGSKVENINTSTYKWNDSAKEWQFDSKGKYDGTDGPYLGPTVDQWSGMIHLWDWYQTNIYNNVKFYIPLPGSSDFPEEFKTLTTTNYQVFLYDVETRWERSEYEYGTIPLAQVTGMLDDDNYFCIDIYYYTNREKTAMALGGRYKAKPGDVRWTWVPVP